MTFHPENSLQWNAQAPSVEVFVLGQSQEGRFVSNMTVSRWSAEEQEAPFDWSSLPQMLDSALVLECQTWNAHGHDFHERRLMFVEPRCAGVLSQIQRLRKAGSEWTAITYTFDPAIDTLDRAKWEKSCQRAFDGASTTL